MSRGTLKSARRLLGITSTTLPIGSYNAVTWETAVLNCTGLDQLLLLLDFTGAPPVGTSVELKSLVEELGTGTFFSELDQGGTLDELSMAVTVITGEGNLVAVPFDCSRFNRVKFQAKKTGAGDGDLALTAIGG